MSLYASLNVHYVDIYIYSYVQIYRFHDPIQVHVSMCIIINNKTISVSVTTDWCLVLSTQHHHPTLRPFYIFISNALVFVQMYLWKLYMCLCHLTKNQSSVICHQIRSNAARRTMIGSSTLSEPKPPHGQKPV